MKNILFLCTGNSCRSQMAEGFGKALKSDKYNFYSAGIVKHGVNVNAMKVMKELDIDLYDYESKTTEDIKSIKMDYVFTVCSDAYETCPFFEGEKIIHVGFDDPPRLTKDMIDEDEILDVYRKVRDEIKEMVQSIEGYIDEA